jgi:hypothetical protein
MNCMDWDATSATYRLPDSKICTKCWTEHFVGDYVAWIGKGVYPELAIKGRDKNTPFVLEGTICKLKCRSGYWSSYNHHFFPETDVMKQRCRGEICKLDNIMGADGKRDPWQCVSCWTKADM